MTYDLLPVIERLSRNIAHEIRNPLTSIKGYAQLLELKSQDDFSLKASGVIQEQVAELEKKLDRIYAVFQTHKAEETACNLFDIIGAEAGKAGGREHITCTVSAAAPVIAADVRLVQRIFFLFFNALNREFYPDTRIICKADCDDSLLTVEITYGGITIPDTELDYLFLPYSSRGLFDTGIEYYELFTLCSLTNMKIHAENRKEGITFILTCQQTNGQER
ncbi:MAG: sensor histidine kinase [Spirochaetota bacterium]